MSDTTTTSMCPHGCGTLGVSTDAYCQGCRWSPAMVMIRPPGSCWEWWGPDWHRMKCLKREGHTGVHSTHDDCGEQAPDYGINCGLPNDHDGPHAWELRDDDETTEGSE